MTKPGGNVNEELIEKWTDALESAEDWLEKNLITEFLEDLRG